MPLAFRKFVFVIKELIDVVIISPISIYPVDKPICNESTRNEEMNPRIELIEPVFRVFVLIRPVFEIEVALVVPSVVPLAVSVVILAEPAPRVLVLRILHTDIFVATPRVLVLIPVELEKKPVLLCPIVVVAPAFSVVI